MPRASCGHRRPLGLPARGQGGAGHPSLITHEGSWDVTAPGANGCPQTQQRPRCSQARGNPGRLQHPELFLGAARRCMTGPQVGSSRGSVTLLRGLIHSSHRHSSRVLRGGCGPTGQKWGKMAGYNGMGGDRQSRGGERVRGVQGATRKSVQRSGPNGTGYGRAWPTVGAEMAGGTGRRWAGRRTEAVVARG